MYYMKILNKYLVKTIIKVTLTTKYDFNFKVSFGLEQPFIKLKYVFFKKV